MTFLTQYRLHQQTNFQSKSHFYKRFDFLSFESKKEIKYRQENSKPIKLTALIAK